MYAPQYLLVYTAPHPETHAYTSNYSLIKAASHKEKTLYSTGTWGLRWILAFSKDFGYTLYYIREHSIPTCFGVITAVGPYGMSAYFQSYAFSPSSRAFPPNSQNTT